MLKNTLKSISKVINKNGIKDIKSIVNKSLGLCMSTIDDELSEICETSSEISNDPCMIPVFENSPIFALPVSQYEGDLENSKHTISSLNDMFNVNVLEKEQDGNVSLFEKNNSDIEATDNSPVENFSNNSFLWMPWNGETLTSSDVSSEEREKKFNASLPLKTKPNIKNKKHFCPHCSKCFRVPSKLKKHIRSHNLSEKASENDKINESPGSVPVMETSNNHGSDAATDSSKTEMRKAKRIQKCPHCSRTFKVFSKLARHIKTHTDSKPYVCQFCSKPFLERFNLLAHINIHKKENTYDCDVCQRSFNFKSNLKRHLKSHLPKEQFFCSTCGEEYSSEKKLEIHVRKHDVDRYKCDECEKVFKKKSNLNRHLKIHLRERSFNFKSNLTRHLKLHLQTEQFICSTCGEECSSEKKLKIHVRKHDGNRYKCDECEKVFNKKSNLKRHLNIHSREWSFNLKSNLTRHLKSHLQKEKFICSTCGKECISEKKLEIHVRKHDGNRYKCVQCEKVFKKKSNLNRHLKIHSRELNYSDDLYDCVEKKINT